MKESLQLNNALERMRILLAKTKGAALDQIAEQRKLAAKQFGPLFTKERVGLITQPEFLSFIKFENDRHWRGASLFGGSHPAAANMETLRKGLAVLVDETTPLEERFSRAIAMVPGLGQSVASAVLTIVDPDHSFAWYGDLEVAVRALDLWPEFKRGTPVGARYQAVNGVLLELAKSLKIDPWTLDSLLAQVSPDDSDMVSETETPEATPGRFILESHLEQYLLANWDQLGLGKDWAIEAEDPDGEQLGQQVPTSVGKIDILARHRTQPRWLVVELKRGQGTDTVLGQVLRYMGCVKKERAEPSETVEGLIIALEPDEKLRNALSVVPNVRMKVYQVAFSLVDVAE